MHLLVLDTIHGGRIIAHALSKKGHAVDTVDIYREKEVSMHPLHAQGTTIWSSHPSTSIPATAPPGDWRLPSSRTTRLCGG